MGKQRKRFWPTLLALAILLTQIGVTFPAPAKAAEGFVIRSDSMTVDATGIYASQTKNVTLPAVEVINATATTDNGTVTVSRNNNQVTLSLSGGNPTSFTNGTVTLTDNGNTSNSGTASKVIAGLYDVTSKTSTNGTVSTTVSGDTLTANWSGGSSYQVRVPPYTQTITTTEYQNYSHYATYASLNGCDEKNNCSYTYIFYSYDSNCNLKSESFTVTQGPGHATGTFGSITCSKPITTTKTADVYNYESRWDYSATIGYRTATYVYNTVIQYDFKDYAPQAPTLTAPQDLSDGGTITFSKPSDDYTPQNELLVSLEWQQEGSSTWNPVFTDKKITDSIFTLSGSKVIYHWDGAGVNGMVKLRLVTKDGYNQPVYSYVNGDPDTMFRMSHKPEITQVSPISGSQANTVTPKYTWNYSQDEGEGQKGFYLQVRKVGETTLSLDTGFVDSTSNEYQHPTSSPLEWGTTYEWRIQPLSETGVLGDWTGWQAFGANSIPVLESVTTVSTDTLHVKTKPTPDTTGYKFYRFGTEIHDGTELEIDDTGLPSNTEQFYNVRAYNAVAQSPLSASKSAYTLAATPEFESVETTATSITVKLKQVNPQYTYHEVEYRKKGETTWLPLGSGASLLYIQNGVEKDTTYEIRVRAFNGMTDPNGTPTKYIQTEATTKVDPPTGAVFSDITEDSFTVTIDPNGNSATTKYRFWIEGVTDKTAYGTALSYTFTGLPEGNRTYTVVGQALGINSESSPIPLGTVTTKAYPIRAEDITLTAEQGKIKGSFLTGKNAAGTKYEISDSATGEVLAFSDTNTTFELSAPNPNEKHVITIRAQDKMLNVTEPVTKEIYSLANPVSSPDLTVVGPNEVKVSFDLNGNPADTEVRIQSVKGDTYDSGWITGSEAQILDLTPNTQQQYAITARNKDGVETTAITSPAKYTLANPIITAQYEPGYTNIKITLLANNPPGTMYKIINKTTGEVRDWSSDVTWDNNPLTNESENEYEALARNGDGIETVVTKLGSMKTLKALGEFVEIPREPADGAFDPTTQDGKTITHNGKTVILVKGSELPLSLHDLKNIVEWKYSINDGPWSEWKSVSDNKIEQKFPVDTPGLYKLSINFKNQFGNDAGNVTKWYLADWIAPQLSIAYDKISKEDNPKFGMTYSDNLDLSYGIWYQVDEQPWQSLTGNEVTGALPRDNKFKKGFVRISDVVGNVKEVPYEILSLNDQYFSIEPREGGYKVTFNVEAKTGQRYHVKTTNLVDDDFQVNESSTTNIIDVPGLTGSKYEATLGIRIPGESFWFDQMKYPVVLGLDMPTLASQDSTTNSIRITVNPVDGAQTYKVQRSDLANEGTFAGLEFVDYEVQPASPYLYEFWAEGGGLKSVKNTITLWTKPANPSLVPKRYADGTLKFDVNLNGNPEDVVVEVIRAGGTPKVTGTVVEDSGVEGDVEYTYQVRVKSQNNEYSEWVTQTFRPGDYVVPPAVPPGPTPEEEFNKKADSVLAAIQYQVGTVAQQAWVDAWVKNAEGLQVTGNVNGITQTLGSSPVRFDGLEIGKEYVLQITVSDGTRSKETQIRFSTEMTEEQIFNRAAEQLVGQFIFTSDGEINSGKAWIEIEAPQSSYTVVAIVEGVSKNIAGTKVRFDNLEDNTTYTVYFEISNGTYTYRSERQVATPNRTAPEVINISKSGDHLQIEVLTHSELKK
ncbi:fibronectin type III domain-containing protein [Brevibacillus brevis]|uniref:Fibronectin type III domain-containing protein n=1 Tax=Brevibacillus brevis TaxID=1393 RepID=A0ABY9T5N0_BREBE|nr:fibronectin type III domain-containing protein [Brevibacillus brevis]WNC15406.1 fibronectin type III domain-containing protein [Brevibacillus brevis]